MCGSRGDVDHMLAGSGDLHDDMSEASFVQLVPSGTRGPLRGRAGKRAALERAGGFSLLALFSLAHVSPS